MSVVANAHSASDSHPGEHSAIHHPPPEDHTKANPAEKEIPDTGWIGRPAIPSEKGGEEEEDFLNKPPYTWKSEGDKFVRKYERSVRPDRCVCED